jgi:hypothetical protein
MTRKVDPMQVRKDEIHRRVAAEIRRDPRVIEQAAARLDRWMQRSGTPPDPALVEWKIALSSLDPGQLADFLESPTPRAKRMRISSPFFWSAR